MEEKKVPVIVIDAGHGGSDSGAVHGKRKEKDDVLKLALAVGKTLEEDYIAYIKYTRTTDIYEKPSKKTKDAEGFGGSLLVSIHRNYGITKTSTGYETLVYSNVDVKKVIAEEVNKGMAELGYKNRGTKIRTDLTILKVKGMPAVLFEVGFISNKADNKIFDNKFDEIVGVIVNAIAKGMELKKKPIEAEKKFENGNFNKNVRTTTSLNVRSGRGTDYKILGTLPKDTVVKALYILTKDGAPWASIDYGKSVGYICLDYVVKE